jgi:hypothetical protein
VGGSKRYGVDFKNILTPYLWVPFTESISMLLHLIFELLFFLSEKYAHHIVIRVNLSQ